MTKSPECKHCYSAILSTSKTVFRLNVFIQSDKGITKKKKAILQIQMGELEQLQLVKNSDRVEFAIDSFAISF